MGVLPGTHLEVHTNQIVAECAGLIAAVFPSLQGILGYKPDKILTLPQSAGQVVIVAVSSMQCRLNEYFMLLPNELSCNGFILRLSPLPHHDGADLTVPILCRLALVLPEYHPRPNAGCVTCSLLLLRPVVLRQPAVGMVPC